MLIKDFKGFTLKNFDKMHDDGMNEKDIIDHFGINKIEFRTVKAAMVREQFITRIEIMDRMKAKGMSRAEIAEILGVSESTILNWGSDRVREGMMAV